MELEDRVRGESDFTIRDLSFAVMKEEKLENKGYFI